MLETIRESVAFIADLISIKPVTGIILGSGLGNLASDINIEAEIPYSTIPHFPVSSIEGHNSKLLIGFYKNIPLVIMQGRVHYYEGYSMHEITHPVRVLKYLGVSTLLLTNAAGGMNPDFSVGDLMVITDHIHLMPNPLIGKTDKEAGTRFPDMSETYDHNLVLLAESLANNMAIPIRKGVYVGVTGPTYETPAEYAFFRGLGGDAVGMSTSSEVIVARQMGMKCFAVSVITDLGVPGQIQFITHKKVQEEATAAEPLVAKLIKAMIGEL
jgi:purine-nucleoside phosphorylase